MAAHSLLPLLSLMSERFSVAVTQESKIKFSASHHYNHSLPTPIAALIYLDVVQVFPRKQEVPISSTNSFQGSEKLPHPQITPRIPSSSMRYIFKMVLRNDASHQQIIESHWSSSLAPWKMFFHKPSNLLKLKDSNLCQCAS